MGACLVLLRRLSGVGSKFDAKDAWLRSERSKPLSVLAFAVPVV